METLQRIGGHAWLVPHNPVYQPILADHAAILGKVVAVVRPVRHEESPAREPGYCTARRQPGRYP